ncbi:hypothetical protein [Tenggerimyces flavus]|uniref:O-methyltransferase n=1 Tax=Tenggerimyces flavus TaxID=1708749 RepID=A0ABV7YDW5_9ACTN|nr:hypothetical protein [Tenggerimyces flavus]MBM7783331.1 SAM-dependent methyltransferase [Tenggerimyces flavus]
MSEPHPETFAALHDAVGTAAVLDSAVQLGVLARLAEGAATPAEVALSCELPERQAHALVVALVSIGVVVHVPPDRFRPAVAGMPAVHRLLDVWRRLPRQLGQNGLPTDPYDFASLDSGAVTRARGLLARPGDRLLEVSTPSVAAAPDSYDLILVDNVCHLQTEPENLRLVARLAPALRLGGRLAIVDVLPSSSSAPPMSLALYELSLAVRTAGGRLHPVAAYRRWLHLAGLLDVSVVPLGGRLPHALLTGARPSA